jgi:glycosyltransferase involved in cell wall biosynthesis
MRVTFYQRFSLGISVSIERLFADVRRFLPDDIEAAVAVSRFASKGFFPRVYNMIEAALRQGDINHITGDVHYLALLLRKRKTLLTIHDLVLVHRLKGWRRSLLLFLWYWLPIKRVAMVSVISESTKKDLLEHIKVDPKKVHVVYDCVSDDFKPFFKEFNALKPVILQIGTGLNKNLERVALALSGVSCHLRIIGKLNAEQELVLERSGVEYSAVYNISDEELLKEYCHCDLVVFASTFEGFGLPIIESQAVGRPVVTSTLWSMPEVAGKAACLVDPFKIEDIKKGVLRVVSDENYRNSLVASGYINVQRFRPQQIAGQYVQLYNKMVLNKTA